MLAWSADKRLCSWNQPTDCLKVEQGHVIAQYVCNLNGKLCKHHAQMLAGMWTYIA